MSRKKNKLVCIGSNIESLVCLKQFLINNICISGLITTKESIERKGSDYRDLVPFATKHNIPYYRTESVNKTEVKEWLKDINPDILFILGWSEMLDEEFISISGNYVIGSHPSDLPYGAGRAPIVWTILEDLRCSAVSFFRANSKPDAGDIVLKEYFTIPIRANSYILYNIVATKLAEGFVKIFKNIQANKLKSLKQDFSKRTVRRKRIYEDGYINFNQKADILDRLIRATTHPFPGAYTFYKKELITIWESDVIVQSNNLKGVPGEILKIYDNKILVQCADSSIWICNFSTQDGKNINIKEFKIGVVLK